jgi:hypothetical protein
VFITVNHPSRAWALPCSARSQGSVCLFLCSWMVKAPVMDRHARMSKTSQGAWSSTKRAVWPTDPGPGAERRLLQRLRRAGPAHGSRSAPAAVGRGLARPSVRRTGAGLVRVAALSCTSRSIRDAIRGRRRWTATAAPLPMSTVVPANEREELPGARQLHSGGMTLCRVLRPCSGHACPSGTLRRCGQMEAP